MTGKRFSGAGSGISGRLNSASLDAKKSVWTLINPNSILSKRGIQALLGEMQLPPPSCKVHVSSFSLPGVNRYIFYFNIGGGGIL